ncbi:MAG: glycine cleavage system protein GcvH [Bacteriovoracaceae bacterium]
MSTNIPSNLKYTSEHEWTLINGDVVVIGITDFAQSSLGDIVFMELPEVGRKLNKGQAFGVVESIKSVSDLFAPVTGEVIESNSALVNSPEKCNQNPYESWMIKIKISNSAELNDLLSAGQYQEQINNNH